MQPRLQRAERQTPTKINYQFAVDYKSCCHRGVEERDNFWKITPERLAGLGPQLDSRARLKGETAETAPFRFVLPATAGVRDGVRRFCFHRRRVKRKPERGSWLRQ
jgi:hypothetical protein